MRFVTIAGEFHDTTKYYQVNICKNTMNEHGVAGGLLKSMVPLLNTYVGPLTFPDSNFYGHVWYGNFLVWKRRWNKIFTLLTSVVWFNCFAYFVVQCKFNVHLNCGTILCKLHTNVTLHSFPYHDRTHITSVTQEVSEVQAHEFHSNTNIIMPYWLIVPILFGIRFQPTRLWCCFRLQCMATNLWGSYRGTWSFWW